jgi:hypothetical protein
MVLAAMRLANRIDVSVDIKTKCCFLDARLVAFGLAVDVNVNEDLKEALVGALRGLLVLLFLNVAVRLGLDVKLNIEFRLAMLVGSDRAVWLDVNQNIDLLVALNVALLVALVVVLLVVFFLLSLLTLVAITALSHVILCYIIR